MDAMLIAAPGPTKNNTGTRDPEMHQTEKGNQWRLIRAEDTFGQSVGLQQATELEQHRRIWRSFQRQVNAHKSPKGLTVMDGVFGVYDGQTEIHAQHVPLANRWAASAFALRVKRLKLRNQCQSRCRRVDFAKQAISSRHLRLGRVLQVGKAALHRLHPFNFQCSNFRKSAGLLNANISVRP